MQVYINTNINIIIIVLLLFDNVLKLCCVIGAYVLSFSTADGCIVKFLLRRLVAC